jgi:hypothetical protein
MTLERSTHNGNRRNWYRSTAARALLAAALTVSLLLGGLFLLVGKLHPSPAEALDHPAQPVSDDQSEAQVLEPAKQIVTTAGLQQPTAGYLLMSCKDVSDPPYQGAIYLNFVVPADVRADNYFRGIADAMVAHGWRQGIPPSRYTYGATLYRGEVTAIVYRDSNVPDVGVLRLYGQCRNMNDHRNDSNAWADITDRLPRPR